MTKLYHSFINNNIELFQTSEYVMYGTGITGELPILSKNIVMRQDGAIVYLIVDYKRNDDNYKVVIFQPNGNITQNYNKNIMIDKKSDSDDIKDASFPNKNVSLFRIDDLTQNGFRLLPKPDIYKVKKIGAEDDISNSSRAGETVSAPTNRPDPTTIPTTTARGVTTTARRGITSSPSVTTKSSLSSNIDLSYDIKKVSDNTLSMLFTRVLSLEEIDTILKNIKIKLNDINIIFNNKYDGEKLTVFLTKSELFNDTNKIDNMIKEIVLVFDIKDSNILIEKILNTDKNEILPSSNKSSNTIIILIVVIIILLIICVIIYFLIIKKKRKINKKLLI